jgi:hypothetical protein
MPEEQNLNIKANPPEKILWAAVAILVVFSVFGLVLIVNGIKEGRYIGQSTEYRKTISISGEGKVLAKPDIGQVSLSVVTQASTVAAAVSGNNDKMNKINQAMKDLGISEDDLKTTAYNINPSYQYTSGKSVIIGYEVNQSLAVKIRDLDKTSQILEKAASLGANQVGSLSFTIDDAEKIKEEAREKAIVNAKEKADNLAKALGVNLGRVVGFDESSGGGTPIPMYDSMLGRGGGGEIAPAPTVSVGQNEIVVNVNLQYEVR